MVKPIEFTTERLFLRQWKESDRQHFAAMSADPEVMEFFLAPLNDAESNAMVDRCQGLIAERGWGFWAVELKQSGQFIGLVGLHIPTAELPFSPCVEIGWRLAKPFWGQGYATEAAQGALRVGFERLGLEEIVAFTAVINQRSQAVMKKLGMQPAADNFDHPAVKAGHPLRRHCLYTLSKSQWLALDNQ
ncbi:GNAT family N-acetyltransferase [Pragia fontium]|uniref:GNAT family N-acetyltransferase n=1 Tax=Pragia fontium TaxID=82985 RepID=UPI000F6C2BD8|nr:GNAT family N-acetyltransferase [Pragia fontium]VEJ52721.1 Putative ribosomal N-acetyltransferase YdaF [Pragia fontium]